MLFADIFKLHRERDRWVIDLHQVVDVELEHGAAPEVRRREWKGEIASGRLSALETAVKERAPCEGQDGVSGLLVAGDRLQDEADFARWLVPARVRCHKNARRGRTR